MNATRCALIVTVLSALLTACNQGSDAGRVAVLDLGRVAQALGQDRAMQLDAQAHQNKLRQDLDRLKKTLDEQIEAERKRAGEKPTPEQEQELANMQGQAQARMNNAVQGAQQEIRRKQEQLFAEFLEKVRPYSRAVANSRGLTVITIRNPNNDVFLDVDASAEITDDVIRAMLEDNQQASPAPVPPTIGTPGPIPGLGPGPTTGPGPAPQPGAGTPVTPLPPNGTPAPPLPPTGTTVTPEAPQPQQPAPPAPDDSAPATPQQPLQESPEKSPGPAPQDPAEAPQPKPE